MKATSPRVYGFERRKVRPGWLFRNTVSWRVGMATQALVPRQRYLEVRILLNEKPSNETTMWFVGNLCRIRPKYFD